MVGIFSHIQTSLKIVKSCKYFGIEICHNLKKNQKYNEELVNKRKIEENKFKQAKKLLQKANDRLHKEIVNQNFKEIELAHAMLAGVQKIENKRIIERKIKKLWMIM